MLKLFVLFLFCCKRNRKSSVSLSLCLCLSFLSSPTSPLSLFSRPPPPLHTHAHPAQLRRALKKAGLKPAGVALRFPEAEFASGALASPDFMKRFRAMALAVEACQRTAELGAGELVVWSQFDGYDYPLQVRLIDWTRSKHSTTD